MMDEHGMFDPQLILIYVTCSYGYRLPLDACSYKLIDHDMASKINFLQITYLVIYHALLLPRFKHGLLASTFKVLIDLSLVISLTRHERTRYDEEYLGDVRTS